MSPRIALLLVMLIGACAPTARERAALDRWYACIECDQGELDSVLTVAGVRTVRTLTHALGGPTQQELENLRLQYLEEYRQLAAASPAPLTETQDGFVSRLMENFVAERAKRAARALARVERPVARWMARRALANARALAEDPAVADRYRPDVSAELRAARVTSVSFVAGGGQADSTGRPVATPPAVLVRDGSTPREGVPTVFRVTAGGGRVTGARTVTDATGRATVGSWTLGPAPGTNVLVATAGAHTDSLVITAIGALVLEVVAGADQSGGAGDTVPTTPVVRALDAQGLPQSGVAVLFEVTQGGGSIAAANVVTGVDGRASPGLWILGAPGVNLLVARATGRPDVIMRAHAVAIPPSVP